MNTLFRYLFLLIIFLSSSCKSPEKVVYLQDVDVLSQSSVTNDYVLRIKKDDLLSIIVTSRSPELVSLFNMSTVNYSTTGASVSGNQQGSSYIVDVNGCIKFPVLGKIKVEGMTRNQLADYIETSLIKNEYVKDPIVTVQFLNFKVSVLGEVNSPGTYEIESERFTLLDAISKAGDLTIHGRRDKVAVIREVNCKRTILYHDLRSSDIFKSPCFYLQQNDVVYVEPNKARSSQRGNFSNPSLWISILSMSLAIFSILYFK